MADQPPFRDDFNSKAAIFCMKDPIITKKIRNVYFGREPLDAAHPCLENFTQAQINYLATLGLLRSNHQTSTSSAHPNQETAAPDMVIRLGDQTEFPSLARVYPNAANSKQATAALQNQEMAAPNQEIGAAVENQEMAAAPDLGEEEIKVDHEAESDPVIEKFENIYKEENKEIGAVENEEIEAVENEEIEAVQNPEIEAVENEEMAAPIQEVEIRLRDEIEFPTLQRFGRISKKERRGEFQR